MNSPILQPGEKDNSPDDTETLCCLCCGDREVLIVGILFPGKCKQCQRVWPPEQLRRVVSMNDNDPYCPECSGRHKGKCGTPVKQFVRISPNDSIESVIKKMSVIRPGSFISSSYENDETRGVVIEFQNNTQGSF
jgi:hypothetical protein